MNTRTKFNTLVTVMMNMKAIADNENEDVIYYTTKTNYVVGYDVERGFITLYKKDVNGKYEFDESKYRFVTEIFIDELYADVDKGSVEMIYTVMDEVGLIKQVAREVKNIEEVSPQQKEINDFINTTAKLIPNNLIIK